MSKIIADRMMVDDDEMHFRDDDAQNKLKNLIVQEKGGSETAVMSQAAATEEFDKLSEEIAKDITFGKSHFNEWEHGTVFVLDGELHYEDNELRCRLHLKTNKGFCISCNDGYSFWVIACKRRGGEYFPVVENGWITSDSFINLSDYAEFQYFFVVARKNDDSVITLSEAHDNVFYSYKTVNVVENNAKAIANNEKAIADCILLLLKEITPSDTQYNKSWLEYYYDPNIAYSVIDVNGAVLKRVDIVQSTEYFVTTKFLALDSGFPLVAYFNENGEYISCEFMNESGEETTITKQKLTVPENATWFYVNSRNTDSAIYKKEIPSMSVNDLIEKTNKINTNEVTILFVGNSLTQDGIMYLPYILKNYFPEVSFRFYVWYNGGYTLAQQYEKFVNNTNCEIFSVAENNSSWSNSATTMSEILNTYKFDIVCMQEYFNYKESYTETDLQEWNNCKNYIQANYKGGNGLKFISLFHAPLRKSSDTVFERTKSGNALILQNTISEDMIPVGISVYRALSTDLDVLGDAGHLSPDGTHTQEGLPCLLQTYTALLWLLDKIGINKSIYGLPFRMNTEIYNSINVGGANIGTGVITGSDSENLLAQEIAIKAFKEGKHFVNQNMFTT